MCEYIYVSLTCGAREGDCSNFVWILRDTGIRGYIVLSVAEIEIRVVRIA